MCALHPTEVITSINYTERRLMCHQCLDEQDRAKDDGKHRRVTSDQLSEKAAGLIKELQEQRDALDIKIKELKQVQSLKAPSTEVIKTFD